MAVSLQSFATFGNPIPSLCGSRETRAFCCFTFSPSFHLEAISPRVLCLAQSSPLKRSPRLRLIAAERRVSRLVPFAAASPEESKDSEIDVDKVPIEIKAEGSQEALNRSLEYFKAEALKLKAMSEEAYKVYSKKTMEILLEESQKLKIQAEKAQHVLSAMANELSEEGKEYLNTTAKNYPDSVKDILETFTSLSELKKISEVRDYHIGIPYGTFLAVGGFLHFMLTGSISAIRFGFILGTALLVLSVSSLRLWKSGQPSKLNLKGQAAIVAIVSISVWCLFFQRRSFSTSLMAIISGAMVASYLYLMSMDGRYKGPAMEQSSEN